MYRVECEPGEEPQLVWDPSMRAPEEEAHKQVWRPPSGVAEQPAEPLRSGLIPDVVDAPVPGAPGPGAHLTGPPVQVDTDPQPMEFGSTFYDKTTVAFHGRLNDEDWRDLPIWNCTGAYPYEEGPEQHMHWTKCFPFYCVTWKSERSKKENGGEEWTFLANYQAPIAIWWPYKNSKLWFVKKRDDPQHLLGVIPEGPPIGVAEVEHTHTDDWKTRRAQKMNSAPVLTPFQQGTPAAVYAYSRKDAQGYWSVQDLNTCSHGHSNQLGEARCRTCK